VRAQSRVTWTMVSVDNAQVVGVEGRTIQLGFKIPTLRQNFLGSKHEDTLRQVLGQVFGGDWRVEVIVDPSAGHGGSSGSGGSGSNQPSPTPPGGGFGGGQPGGGQWASTPAPPQQPAAQARPSAAPSPPSPAPAPSAGSGPGPLPSAAAASTGTATATLAPPAPEPESYAASAAVPRVPNPSSAPRGYDSAPPPFADAPPPFVDEPPPEDYFDPHLAALNDEAVPNDPGPSARDLLIKELGASIVDEARNTD